MSFTTPAKRVLGLGSAKEGTGHFWSQRVTAIALVPLTLLFVFPLGQALGSPLAEVRAIYAHPFNAIVAALFLLVMFEHLRLGLQVVIEDYVHAPAWKTGSLLFNSFFCRAFALIGVYAVARLALFA